MLCDKCKKNEAKVFVMADINGKKSELHLCGNCAKSSKLMDLPLSLISMDDVHEKGNVVAELLGLKMLPPVGKKSKKSHAHYVIDDIEKIFGFLPTPEFIIDNNQKSLLKEGLPSVCPLCGTKFSEIMTSMRFGCANCYKTYGRYILKKATESESMPTDVSDILSIKKSKVEKLKIRLANAIKKEDYERAAIIRDEIKKLTEDLKEERPK